MGARFGSCGDAGSPQPAGRGVVSGPGRPRLSHDRVVGAALALIDTEGLGALSMRRVAQSLGVEAMSLYGYVAHREALLDAVVDSVIDELWADPQVQVQPEDGWREYLTCLAHGTRRIAVAHPRTFPLVATRPPEAPFIRPPLRSLRWLEAFLLALRNAGWTDEAVLYAYRAFTSFLLGHLLLEAGGLSAQDPVVDALPHEPLPADAPNTDTADPTDRGVDVHQRDATTASVAGAPLHDSTADRPRVTPLAAAVTIDDEQYPTVAELAVGLAQDHSAQEFTDGLDDLLDRLARHPGATPDPSPAGTQGQ